MSTPDCPAYPPVRNRSSARLSANRVEQAAESALWHRWREDRDLAARTEIVRRFLPLARKLASRYQNAYEPFDDLMQVAALGLVNAVDRFDSDRGIAFPSFAIPTILGELKRHFRNTGWSVHVPRRAQELALTVERTSRHLSEALGRSPSVEEVAGYLEIGTEDVVDAMETAAVHHSTSLQATTGGDEGDSTMLQDTIGGVDERYEYIETTSALAAAIRELPFKERQAITLRLDQDLKQTQIADLMGVSQMQVSRLLRRAANRLKELTDPAL